MKNNKHIFIGIIIGLITPTVVMYSLYEFYYKDFNMLEGYNDFVMPKILALCGVSNLIIFYLFINILKNINLAKGVVISTILYGISIFIYKTFF